MAALQGKGQLDELMNFSLSSILNNQDIIGPVWGGLLAAFYNEGGKASCKELGNKYHRSASSISGNCTQLTKRIQKETGCPIYIKNGKEMLWYILFCLHDTNQVESINTIWTLRPELYTALKEFDILRFQWSVNSRKDISAKSALEQINQYIASKGFSYSEGMIENFYLSLKSKPFVTLKPKNLR